MVLTWGCCPIQNSVGGHPGSKKVANHCIKIMHLGLYSMKPLIMCSGLGRIRSLHRCLHGYNILHLPPATAPKPLPVTRGPSTTGVVKQPSELALNWPAWALQPQKLEPLSRMKCLCTYPRGFGWPVLTPHLCACYQALRASSKPAWARLHTLGNPPV